MIELGIDMAIAVNEYLVKNNLRKSEYKIFDDRFKKFSQSELDGVLELCLTNCYDISGLVYLKNLKKLHIKSTDYNKLAPFINYEDSQVINHITDFTYLTDLINLDELVIANDLYVEEIDISKMINLRKLVLINNPKLKSVKGLDKLEKLNEVTMYGNDISGYGFDFETYIKNTRFCVENTLDISMYLGIIDNNREKAKILENYEVTGNAFVRFAEKSGFLNCVCLSLRDLYELYLNLDVYFKKYNVYNLNEMDKIEFVYKYIINNTKFSKDLIIDRNIAYLADKEQYDEIPDKIRKMFNNFHSSFYAHRFKIANCGGRVNLMVFMLRMLGIDAFNVHCHDNRDCEIGSNHSITRINTDSGFVYVDASLSESYKKSELIEKNSDKDISKYFYCVDYDFMSNYVTMDSYEYSLYEKNKKNNKVKKLNNRIK